MQDMLQNVIAAIINKLLTRSYNVNKCFNDLKREGGSYIEG